MTWNGSILPGGLNVCLSISQCHFPPIPSIYTLLLNNGSVSQLEGHRSQGKDYGWQNWFHGLQAAELLNAASSLSNSIALNSTM
jgi:hypothetical protein